MTTFTFLAQTTMPAVEQPADAQQQTSTARPGTPPTTQPKKDAPFWTNPMLLPILVIALLFFFMSRSRKNQDKQRQSLLDKLKKGDRVQTIGGIIGTVIDARESEVLLKVDESSNTKIRFSRNAIHRVVEEEKSEAK